jgi:hypothetical protein
MRFDLGFFGDGALGRRVRLGSDRKPRLLGLCGAPSDAVAQGEGRAMMAVRPLALGVALPPLVLELQDACGNAVAVSEADAPRMALRLERRLEDDADGAEPLLELQASAVQVAPPWRGLSVTCIAWCAPCRARCCTATNTAGCTAAERRVFAGAGVVRVPDHRGARAAASIREG